MKNEYRNMMEQLTLSPAARSAIAEGIADTAPKKKYLSRPILRAAAAACLCLLLPVSAMGISKLFEPVELGQQTVSEDMSSYKVVADVVPWSPEQFSDALQKDLKDNTVQQTFQDKESLEAYLGMTLADSPALEEAGIVDDLAKSFEYGFCLRPQLEIDTSARYILTACDLDGNMVEADPSVLKVSCHRVMQNMECYLDAWIVLDSVTMEELEEGILGENFLPVTGWTHEFLYDEEGNFLLGADGFPILEPTQFTSSEYDFTEMSHTMDNGSAATIIVSRLVEPDGYGIYEYMGYFIQDDILYTVRPYAIYDPALDFPMHDKDALIVLRDVLDTFA